LGNYVIAALNLGTVNWYSDIPSILVEKGYVNQELGEKWVRMIGFRNALVRDYLDVDRRIVYEVLQNGLGDLEALRNVFARFL